MGDYKGLAAPEKVDCLFNGAARHHNDALYLTQQEGDTDYVEALRDLGDVKVDLARLWASYRGEDMTADNELVSQFRQFNIPYKDLLSDEEYVQAEDAEKALQKADGTDELLIAAREAVSLQQKAVAELVAEEPFPRPDAAPEDGLATPEVVGTVMRYAVNNGATETARLVRDAYFTANRRIDGRIWNREQLRDDDPERRPPSREEVLNGEASEPIESVNDILGT